MPSRSVIPGDYDPSYIAAKAGLVNNWGWETRPDGQIDFVYPVSKYEDVIAAIESFAQDFLSVKLPQKISRLMEIRDERIKAFMFGPFPIELDLETKANLVGAVVGLEKSPDTPGIDWSLGGGVFVFLDRETLFALANACFAHIQHCFTRARELTQQLIDAEDIEALAAVDIASDEVWSVGAPETPSAPSPITDPGSESDGSGPLRAGRAAAEPGSK